MNIFRFLHNRIAQSIFSRTGRSIRCHSPFLPDERTDMLYGGFSIREISDAAKSVEALYRTPMCMLCAGYGYRETALLLGVSERVLAGRIRKGHALFMKALKANRPGIFKQRHALMAR